MKHLASHCAALFARWGKASSGTAASGVKFVALQDDFGAGKAAKAPVALANGLYGRRSFLERNELTASEPDRMLSLDEVRGYL